MRLPLKMARIVSSRSGIKRQPMEKSDVFAVDLMLAEEEADAILRILKGEEENNDSYLQY